MGMDPVSAVSGAVAELTSSIGRTGLATASSQAPDFSRWMTDQLTQVDQQIETAETSLERLAMGDGSLHQVMLDLEKARTAFQLTLQVRNKVLEGFQEILRMQI